MATLSRNLTAIGRLSNKEILMILLQNFESKIWISTKKCDRSVAVSITMLIKKKITDLEFSDDWMLPAEVALSWSVTAIEVQSHV